MQQCRFRQLPLVRKVLTLTVLASFLLGALTLLADITGILSFFGADPFRFPPAGEINKTAITAPSDSARPFCPKAPSLVAGQPIYLTIMTEPAGSRSCYVPSLSPVQPGSTLKYLITYQNASNKVQSRVTVRVVLGSGLLLGSR
jgi:hypothetical protein